MIFHRLKKYLCFLIIILIGIQPGIADESSITLAALTKTTSSTTNKDVSQNAGSSIWTRLRGRFSIQYSESGSRVQSYIHKFTRGNWLHSELKVKAAPYLHFVMEEVEKRGMPSELALLPLIESSYEPNSLQSRTGAAGLWQIMPATGEWFGLKRDGNFDGRQDIHASTKAALNHLSYLHKKFNRDWLLTLAAYNCGEGRVLKAIKKNKAAGLSTDYWSLPLPQETKDYVPKLLAVVSVIKHPDKYGFTLPPLANQPYLARVPVEGGLDLQLAAKLADISLAELRRHNAGLQKPVVPTHGPYFLLVPIAKAHRFEQQLASSNNTKTQQAFRYRVQSGDSLSVIAGNFQTSIAAIQKANELNSVVVHPGQTLLIPGRYQPASKEESSKAITHIVKKGDSLWTISQLYQTPVPTIVKRNNLASSASLRPGQKIFVDKS
jgi:membrane-bound lytic murein transglycosylase D